MELKKLVALSERDVYILISNSNKEHIQICIKCAQFC